MSCIPTLPNTRVLVSPKSLFDRCPICNTNLTWKTGTEKTKECQACGYSVTERTNRYRHKPWYQSHIPYRHPRCILKGYCKHQTWSGKCLIKNCIFTENYQKQERYRMKGVLVK